MASETPNLAGGVRFSPGSPFEVKERKDMTIPLNTSKTVRIALGWANGWTDEPQIVKDCKAENHPFKERNLDPTMHGFDHLIGLKGRIKDCKNQGSENRKAGVAERPKPPTGIG